MRTTEFIRIKETKIWLYEGRLCIRTVVLVGVRDSGMAFSLLTWNSFLPCATLTQPESSGFPKEPSKKVCTESRLCTSSILLCWA